MTATVYTWLDGALGDVVWAMMVSTVYRRRSSCIAFCFGSACSDRLESVMKGSAPSQPCNLLGVDVVGMRCLGFGNGVDLIVHEKKE